MQPQSPFQQGGQPYGPTNPHTPPTPGGQPGQTYQPAGQPLAQPGYQPGTAQPYGTQPAPAQRPVQQPGTPTQTPPYAPVTQPAANGGDAAVTPEAPATPYDFFMQPKPAQPINPLPVSGRHYGNLPIDPNAKPKTGLPGLLNGRFPLIAGGGIILVILLFVGISLLPKDQSGQQLFTVAQQQQEVIRLCTSGQQSAKLRATKYFAISCASSVTTNQQELLAYMNKQGYKYNAKLIGGLANNSTTSRLKAATASSSYDDTFRDVIQSQLNSYNQVITSQLGVTTGDKGREVLSRSQRAAELLIQMAKDDSDKTEAAPDN